MIRILKDGAVAPEEIFARVVPETDVAGAVRAILNDVRERGDAALRDYTERFDGVRLTELEVSKEEWAEGIRAVEPEFLAVLKKAAANIRRFHAEQVRTGYRVEAPDGSFLAQRIQPLDRVGVYVPGGTAAYPSTVLMDVTPAKLAGVKEIVMVSPPGKDGKLPPAILAAAEIAGVDRIFKVGGAQAVAALTYGTETVPGADKIVGPGNAFVAEAKKQVFGRVAIDMIAGPSEILIIADGHTDPRFAAADLLSQAEHDRLASAVLITDSQALAEAVQAELEVQLAKLEREEIARAAIDRNGKIIVTGSISRAVEVSNLLAPEHLELCVDEPEALLDSIRCAGSIFLGRSCPEALGDYLAGPNHTLPTGGTARFSSPLSVDDFIRKSQVISYTPSALAAVSADVARFARKEGLTAHAASVLIREERGTEETK